MSSIHDLTEITIDGQQIDFSSLENLLEKNGFVLIKNFLSEKYLSPIWSDLEKLANSFFDKLDIEKIDVPNTEIDKLFTHILKSRPDVQSVLYDRIQMMPSLLALPNSKPCIQLAQNLHHTDRIGVWPRVQMRLDLREDKQSHIRWHTDNMYNEGTEFSYTYWISIVNMISNMGLPRIAKGSHKLKDIKFLQDGDDERRFNYTLPDSIISNLDVWDFDSLDAGDLLLFHSMTIHTGMMNSLDSRARLTGLFRMQNLNMLDVFNT